MTKRLQTASLLAIVLLAAALRIYQLRDLPAGLYCDEAGLGYNAYAIASHGVDENGKPFPLFFWSFGVSYKNPVFVYAATIPVTLLGLDEFSVRLTSALFGIGTVAAIFFLGRALCSPGVGLLAALALAVCPWHLHFSRIAFELIAFPFLFTIGATLLVRFTQGRRTLPAAFFFLGACPYAYAIANLFVPLFLLSFVILYLDRLWRHWRQTLLALAVLAATLTPVVRFNLAHPQQTRQYFRHTSFLQPGMTWPEIARRFGSNYLTFVSPRFLFVEGDEIARHAVRGHGELYPAFLPVLLLGALVALLRRERASKLVLLWLALYPVGASLMLEIPSASRGIIGVVPLCVLAALGAGSVLWAIARAIRWRPAARLLQGAALAGAGYILTPQVGHYLDLYFHDYPRYSAPTYGGFQYGYRDMIQFMERERPRYKTLMMTATEVNQPQIFPLFYRRLDPLEYRRTGDIGYEILDPAEIARYSLEQPILYALREPELKYFSDYTVKKRIVAPGEQVEFVIAEVRARKQFLTRWLSLGLLDNEPGAGPSGVLREEIDPRNVHGEPVAGKFGAIAWRPVQTTYLRVDLNQFYAAADRDHPGNPEHVCAYAFTRVRSPAAQPAFLELTGTEDWMRIWLNGHAVTAAPLRLSEHPNRQPIALTAGENALLVKSCEDVGEWYFTARITGADGRDVPGLDSHADLPAAAAPPAGDAAAGAPQAATAVQVVEGFDGILYAAHADGDQPDYRGSSDAWSESLRDDDEIVWRTAPCPEKKTTVVAFTATLGAAAGTADLYVNGAYALSFATNDSPETQIVEQGDYRLVFVSKSVTDSNSGFASLTVPAAAITAGQPLELRVTHSSGTPEASFALHAHRDTAAFEAVTSDQTSPTPFESHPSSLVTHHSSLLVSGH